MRRHPIPNLVQNTHWGLMGKWVKYNKNYFLYINPYFSQTRIQVRPVDGFLRAIAQKT